MTPELSELEQERDALRERVAELEARLTTAVEFDTSTWSMVHGNDSDRLYVIRGCGIRYHCESSEAAFAKLRELGLWPEEKC